MGSDKALLRVEGVPNAVRLARLLTEVAEPLVEVGPGISGLPAVSEEPAQQGPLVALCAGAAYLRAAGHLGPVLVLACDLVLLGPAALGLLACWPGDVSVLPVVGGRPQPLVARWSSQDLAEADRLVGDGERSMKALLGRPGTVLVDEGLWPAGVTARDFTDVDTPAELERLGLS
jgi:molybdopterin-guanine dinucleotide biosynthesis protein A